MTKLIDFIRTIFGQVSDNILSRMYLKFATYRFNCISPYTFPQC